MGCGGTVSEARRARQGRSIFCPQRQERSLAYRVGGKDTSTLDSIALRKNWQPVYLTAVEIDDLRKEVSMLGNEGTPGWRCEGAVRVTARNSQAPVLDVLWTDASLRRIRDAMRSSHDPQITIWYGEDLSPEDAVSRREDWREWLLESCGQPSAESRGRVFHGPGVLCGIARAVWSSAESTRARHTS